MRLLAEPTSNIGGSFFVILDEEYLHASLAP
jgi:hypothetical protein